MVIHLLQQTHLDSLLNPMGDLEQLAKEPAMQVRVLGAGCARGAAQSTWTLCKQTDCAGTGRAARLETSTTSTTGCKERQRQ